MENLTIRAINSFLRRCRMHTPRFVMGSLAGMGILFYFLLPLSARAATGGGLAMLLFLYLVSLNANLKSKLDNTQKTLNRQILRSIEVTNNLANIEMQLKQLESFERTPKLARIINIIASNRSSDNGWRYFDSCTSASFDKNFTAKYPDLTITEKRLAALLRLNLTNREIADILHIEINSVKVAKYRLKRRLDLTHADNIHAYLQRFG